MIIQCVLWTLAIYGFLHICINAILRYIYKEVEVTIKIKKANCFEYIIRSLEYKLWYLKNVTYINDIKNIKMDDVADKLQQDYGVRIIKNEWKESYGRNWKGYKHNLL